MVELGGSRSLSDTWTYVQDSEPTDTRNGVQWVDSSTNTVYRYSSEYGDWMRESRVWVQDVEPNPRVGPLDGDQWIDSSQNNRPTYVYSATESTWMNPVNVATSTACYLYDGTNHTGLSGSGATLYAVELGLADTEKVGVTFDASLEGANTSGSGGYPKVGLRIETTGGTLIHDMGTWTNFTTDGFTKKTTSHTLALNQSRNQNSPIDSTVQLAVYDQDGGGASGDEVRNCEIDAISSGCK